MPMAPDWEPEAENKSTAPKQQGLTFALVLNLEPLTLSLDLYLEPLTIYLAPNLEPLTLSLALHVEPLTLSWGCIASAIQLFQLI